MEEELAETVAESDVLSSEAELDFHYTDMGRAPEHHVTTAYLFAMGMQIWDISSSTGYTASYIEKVLSHPPVIAAIVQVKEALNKRVLQSLNTWTQLLDKSIGVLDASLGSTNERIALTAATEYLDRHQSGMFIKRKASDIQPASKVMDNNAIEELKHHALKLKEDQDGERDEGESDATGSSANATASSDIAVHRGGGGDVGEGAGEAEGVIASSSASAGIIAGGSGYGESGRGDQERFAGATVTGGTEEPNRTVEGGQQERRVTGTEGSVVGKRTTGGSPDKRGQLQRPGNTIGGEPAGDYWLENSETAEASTVLNEADPI